MFVWLIVKMYEGIFATTGQICASADTSDLFILDLNLGKFVELD